MVTPPPLSPSHSSRLQRLCAIAGRCWQVATGLWWPLSRRALLTWRWLVALIALYLLAGFTLVPMLLSWGWPQLAQRLWQQPAAVAEIRFNPLTFELSARDLRLGKGEPAALQIAHLTVDADLIGSALAGAWTLTRVEANGVALAARRDASGELDIAWLWQGSTASAAPAEEQGTIPRFQLEQLSLQVDQLLWRDAAVLPAVEIALTPLRLEVDGLRSYGETPAQLSLTLVKADGGALHSDLSLSLQPLVVDGTVNVSQLPLASGWSYLAPLLNLQPPQGTLTAAANLHLAVGGDQASRQPLLSHLDLEVRDLGLVAAEGEPLANLQRISLGDASLDLDRQRLVVATLAVTNGKVAAHFSASGSSAWQQLIRSPQASEGEPAPPAEVSAAGVVPAPAAPAPASPWQLTLAQVKVDRLALAVTDQRPAQPFALAIDNIELALAAELVASSSPQVSVDLAQLTLTNSRFGGISAAPVVAVERLALGAGRFDLANQQMAMTAITLAGWQVNLERDRQGQWPLAALVSYPAVAAEPTPSPVAASNPWQVKLDQFNLSGGELTVTDQVSRSPLVYQLKGIAGSVTPLVWPLAGTSKLQLTSERASAGQWQLAAELDLERRSADASYRLEGLDLLPLQPLLSQKAAVEMHEGWLYSNGKLKVDAAGDGEPTWQLTGTASFGKVAISEKSSDEPVVGWYQLRADGIAISGSPLAVRVAKVKLKQPSAKVVIFSDRTTNFSRLKMASSASPEQPPKAARDADLAPAVPLVVDRVEVFDGAVDFADLSLILPFATKVHSFTGSITGISSEPSARATLQLEGEVAEYGEARVTGSLAPAAPKTFSDVQVQFRNLALSPLSPYSATFAGRRIASGRINLDLQYHVENSKLKSDNSVVLKGLTLGEEVESPDAISLPLDLALALLTDSDGKIDIALPLRGDVDSPEFSYGHLVGQAVVNLLTGIVSSPFRALAGLFGGDGELPATVGYLPGRALLSGAEKEQVLNLADALIKRPQLALVAHGGYDPELDREALRQAALRDAVAAAQDTAVSPSERFAPLALTEGRTQFVLEQLLQAHLGSDAINEVIAAYLTKYQQQPDRLTAEQADRGQASGDVDYYQMVADRLVPTMVVSDEQLFALARQRGEAVIATMASAGVAKERLSLAAEVDKTKAQGGGTALDLLVGIRLELSAR